MTGPGAAAMKLKWRLMFVGALFLARFSSSWSLVHCPGVPCEGPLGGLCAGGLVVVADAGGIRGLLPWAGAVRGDWQGGSRGLEAGGCPPVGWNSLESGYLICHDCSNPPRKLEWGSIDVTLDTSGLAG